MASQFESNVEKLQGAGFTVKENTPQDYIDVIEAMSNHEINTLIELKQRLDYAQDARDEGPDWQKCVWPF
jgi:hypothetical protein